MTWTLHSRSYKYNRDKTLYVHACMIIYININLCDEIYMHVPVAEKGDRQKEERGSSLSIEDEDVRVDAMVEGRLGNHEHAGVDHLYADGYAIRLLACSVVHASSRHLRIRALGFFGAWLLASYSVLDL